MVLAWGKSKLCADGTLITDTYVVLEWGESKFFNEQKNVESFGHVCEEGEVWLL